MITEIQNYFIDILKIVPFEESIILIQAPYQEVSETMNKISYKNDGVYFYIKLDRDNRAFLLFEIIYNEIEGYIQSLEILVNDKKFFEGYDGMEYGTISKEILLPQEFKRKYIEGDMCTISTEW